jgi:P27 family predicted phage terminase small subunit
MSRHPKPTELHKLMGTYNVTKHGRDRMGEPIAVGNLADTRPPSWMSAEEVATWDYALSHAPVGIVKCIDLSVFAVWVVAEVQHRVAAARQHALDERSDYPLLYRDKTGALVPSPYLGVMDRAAVRLMKAADHLGFSPASRPRLATGIPNEPAEDSPWARFKVIRGDRDPA